MPFGFYLIMAAQFFSALADNVLLIVAIAALQRIISLIAVQPVVAVHPLHDVIASATVQGVHAARSHQG